MTDTERVAQVPRPRAGERRHDEPPGPAAAGGPRGVAADVLLGLAVAAVMVAAVVHFDLWADQGFRQIPKIGPLFLLDAIGGVVITVVAVAWRHWLPVLAVIGFGAVTVGAYFLSVTVGLFGLHETTAGTPQLICEIAEIAAVVLGTLLLVVRGRPGRAHGGTN
jgi:hypothetical protein